MSGMLGTPEGVASARFFLRTLLSSVAQDAGEHMAAHPVTLLERFGCGLNSIMF